MGRKSKLLDPHVRETILEYIRNGNYIKTACMAAGIDETTYCHWVQRAEVGGGNGDELYIQFLQELKRARQENITKRVSKIQDAGEKEQHWTANAWLLERMESADFGKRVDLAVGPSKVLIALQEQARQDRLPRVEVISESVLE